MDQLSTGKKVNRPSDDPVVAMKGMNYRTQVEDIEQYQRNITEVNTWMDNSDAALDEATQALQRLRELAVQGSNGTYEEGQRDNIASEIDQLKEHLVDIANTKVNNKYVFNGTKTTGTPDTNGDLVPPVTVGEDGMVTRTASSEGPVNIEVSDGVRMKVNINPNEVFGEKLFKDIEAFSSALKNDDQQGIQEAIANIDKNIDNVVDERADLGARMNRVELIENRIAGQEITANEMMSDNEDADMEKVIMNLTNQETVHRAALGAGSRVIQPTLLDFLR